MQSLMLKDFFIEVFYEDREIAITFPYEGFLWTISNAILHVRILHIENSAYVNCQEIIPQTTQHFFISIWIVYEIISYKHTDSFFFLSISLVNIVSVFSQTSFAHDIALSRRTLVRISARYFFHVSLLASHFHYDFYKWL